MMYAHNWARRNLIDVLTFQNMTHITIGQGGLGTSKGASSPQGPEGMQLVIIKNYMNIFIFHK